MYKKGVFGYQNCLWCFEGTGENEQDRLRLTSGGGVEGGEEVSLAESADESLDNKPGVSEGKGLF